MNWNRLHPQGILEELRALKQARSLLLDEAKWTTMPDCYSEHGNLVVPWGRAAVEFSLIAALVRYDRPLNNLWNNTDGHALVRILGGRSIMDVADWSEASGRTHEEIIDLLDRGIALLAREHLDACTIPLFEDGRAVA